MTALSPDQFHPHLAKYRDGGRGGVGEDHSVVGYVSTRHLAGIPGNYTDQAGVDRHRKALQSGEGFHDPVMVIYDHKTGQGFVGEGNHRVAAAAAEGITHVPTRVVRGNSKEMTPDFRQGRLPGRLASTKPSLPWKGGLGEEYVPSDIHPAHVFDKRHVL